VTITPERIAEMQRQLGLLTARMQRSAELMPEVSASDSEGSVRVSVAGDYSVTSIVFTNDWLDRISHQEVADAVMQATSAAYVEYMAKASVVRDEVAALPDSEFERPAAEAAEELAADPFLARINSDTPFEGTPRSLSALVDELTALSEVEIPADGAAAESEPRVNETGGTIFEVVPPVVLSLTSTQLTGCTVDSAWAIRQSGAALTAAFDEALVVAREAPSQTTAANPISGKAEELIAEAMQVFKNFRLP